MKAEILCVGTELLLGDTVNTNAAYISKQLSTIAIDVFHQSVIGDNEERLYSCAKSCLKNSDILITTGGLGPTYDDMTKEVIASVFNRKLVLNQEILNGIKTYFENLGRDMPKTNEKQALIPENAKIIPNPNGTAPGIIIEDEENGKVAVMLPGVPSEMEAMIDLTVIPYLSKFSKNVLVSRNIRFFGIGESALEQQLRDIMKSSLNPTIAPYAKTGEVLLRVTAKAETKEKAEDILSPTVDKLYSMFSDYIYGIDIPNLETALVNLLKEKNKTVAAAESCTGGLFAKRITDISGSSKVFELAVCSYSDRIKNEVLGVKKETLEKYTAVSEQTAKEMAQGIKCLSNADIAVSITGVAGPGDLSEDKPYGLVFIGIESENNSEVIKLRLGNQNKEDRNLVRYLATSHALANCLKILKNN